MVELKKNRVIVIRNEEGAAIGALTGEPRTGVERVLAALEKRECAHHPGGKCISVTYLDDSILAVIPAHKEGDLMKIMEGFPLEPAPRLGRGAKPQDNAEGRGE